MNKKKTYNLMEFQQSYATEESCETALFALKWKDGFQCPKCGHQTTVTVGTIMENSKIPLVKWFWALFFLAQNKDSLSSVALAKYLGITQPSAWLMLQEIRLAMGSRDTLYKLGGTAEMDEAFFGGKKSGGKRGRGSDKAKVAACNDIQRKGNADRNLSWSNR